MGSKGEAHCMDDDECILDIHHCDPRAVCQNTNGSYTCTCLPGYEGDGFECKVGDK